MARTFASGDLISTADDAIFDTAVGTVCFWMKTSQAGANFSLVNRTGTDGADGIIIFGRQADDFLGVQLKRPFGSGQALDLAGNTTIRDGNWHHIGFVFRTGNGETGRLYVDGPQQNSGTNSAAWSFAGATEDVRAGTSPDAFWTNFAGTMAELAWWSVEVPATAMLQMAKGYSATFYPTGLIWYERVLGFKSPEPDEIGGRNGTVTGTVYGSHPSIIYPSNGFFEFMGPRQ